jgi:cysteine desulfurase
MIYLDYAANTPVDKEVLNLFYDTTLNYYANPNSVHKLGLGAKKLLDLSTKNIAENLHVLPEEIIYTSGSTESNNLVIKGICERYKNKGKHVIVSALEHNSIIASATNMQELGFEIDMLSVDNNGIVDLEQLKKLMREDTILVSVCAVDSELGIKQPLNEISNIISNYPNCYFHTDATQAIGKVSIDFTNIDLVTIAPHKFYGMNGIGALIKKKRVSLKPQISGGKSTTVYRSGTPILGNVVAFDKALAIALEHQEERNNYVNKLNDMVRESLSKYSLLHINSPITAAPHTLNISVKGVKSSKFVEALQEYDIYVSAKTSCCPENTPSKMVYAVSKDKGLSTSSLRISFSHLTTYEEVEKFLSVFDICYKELVK